MTSWDERFREGTYPQEPTPSPLLRSFVYDGAGKRALDIATGTGRNAVYLAEEGYDVDAIDQSGEGLRITRERAEARGVEGNLSLTQADAKEFDYPTDAYDVVTISFFRTLDRLGDVKAALKPGGLLFYQHHLRSPDSTVGPSGDRYRFRANELLNACLDMTVLQYEARTERVEREEGERVSVTAGIVARNSHGGRQSYPTPRLVGDETGDAGDSRVDTQSDA